MSFGRRGFYDGEMYALKGDDGDGSGDGVYFTGPWYYAFGGGRGDSFPTDPTEETADACGGPYREYTDPGADTA